MRVGINYPWLHCGWDFGPVPPGYGQRSPLHEVRADLERLALAGVSIVRWFVLADGFVYGTGEHAPKRAKRRFRFSAEAELAPSFVEDFVALLALCSELGLQLLPVLIDHQFAFPGLAHDSQDAHTLSLWNRGEGTGAKPALGLLAARERASRLPRGYVKGGRSDVLSDARVAQRFFDHALVPLLAASQTYAHVIYAWELINEPEWIMRRVPFEPGFRVARSDLCRFMNAGLSVIRDYGFVSTIGFARARTLRALQAKLPALSLNQIHYYPAGRFARLAQARFANGRPALLGEFATRSDVLGPWPDLSPERQTVAARLSLAEAQGYQAALVWSYRARDRATLEDREQVAREIALYTKLTPCR